MRILIAEDEVELAGALKFLLEKNRFSVDVVHDGEEALERFRGAAYDVIVLDIMMSGIDGYDFARQLRECNNDIPILMLSAKQLPEDGKKGFLSGTDDYMTKPVDEDVMLLRIRALLRRAKIISDRKLTVGSTILDYDTLTVKNKETSQLLPQKEFQLLYKLLSYPNKIFTRIQLMEDIWGPASDSTDATVSVHINRLRKRFEACTDFSDVTIRGLGYKAQVEEELV